MRVKQIDWETDGVEVELPTAVTVPSDLEEDEIADYLSDQYGWLVNGFVMEAESFGAECGIQENSEGEWVCGWDADDTFCTGHHCEVCSISLCRPDCGDEYCSRTRSPATEELNECMLCAYPLAEGEEYDSDLDTWVKDGKKIQWKDGNTFSYGAESFGAENDNCPTCRDVTKEYTEYQKCGDCGIAVCGPDGCGFIAQDSSWNNNWDWLCKSCYDEDIELGVRSERHKYSIYDAESFSAEGKMDGYAWVVIKEWVWRNPTGAVNGIPASKTVRDFAAVYLSTDEAKKGFNLSKGTYRGDWKDGSFRQEQTGYKRTPIRSYPMTIKWNKVPIRRFGYDTLTHQKERDLTPHQLWQIKIRESFSAEGDEEVREDIHSGSYHGIKHRSYDGVRYKGNLLKCKCGSEKEFHYPYGCYSCGPQAHRGKGRIAGFTRNGRIVWKDECTGRFMVDFRNAHGGKTDIRLLREGSSCSCKEAESFSAESDRDDTEYLEAMQGIITNFEDSFCPSCSWGLDKHTIVNFNGMPFAYCEMGDNPYMNAESFGAEDWRTRLNVCDSCGFSDYDDEVVWRIDGMCRNCKSMSGAESFGAEMDGKKLIASSYDLADGSMMVGVGTETLDVDDPDFMEMMIDEDGKIKYFTLPIGLDKWERSYRIKPTHYGKMKTQNETNEAVGGDFIRTDGEGKYAESFASYDMPISERQRYRIRKLGGRIDKAMNRSDASRYIKSLMAVPLHAETADCPTCQGWGWNEELDIVCDADGCIGGWFIPKKPSLFQRGLESGLGIGAGIAGVALVIGLLGGSAGFAYEEMKKRRD